MAGVRGEPGDLLLWQSAALASRAEAAKLPVQRLYQVSAEKTTKSVWCIIENLHVK